MDDPGIVGENDDPAGLPSAAEPLSPEVARTTAETLIAIGNRIREARLARGMTLQAIAQRSGVSASMLSLVERGRASPSIGSLVVIANALGLTMCDLMTGDAPRHHRLVTRGSDAPLVATGETVVRRLMRDDRERGILIALNEYEPHTGNAERPTSHEGFEYGFVLEGELTVDVDGVPHTLAPGDLIGFNARRQHRIWNHGPVRVRTLWFNFDRA